MCEKYYAWVRIQLFKMDMTIKGLYEEGHRGGFVESFRKGKT
jgi:hypothetical protein